MPAYCALTQELLHCRWWSQLTQHHMQGVGGVGSNPLLVLHKVLVSGAHLTHRDVDDWLGQHHKVMILIKPKLHLWTLHCGGLEEEVLEPFPSNTDIWVHWHQCSILTLELGRDASRQEREKKWAPLQVLHNMHAITLLPLN